MTQDRPSSAFCMRTWVRVQRIPPMKEANSTMMKPSMLNWVDSNVNIKSPLEISRTTRIRKGFWLKMGTKGQNRRCGEIGISVCWKSFNDILRLPFFSKKKIQFLFCTKRIIKHLFDGLSTKRQKKKQVTFWNRHFLKEEIVKLQNKRRYLRENYSIIMKISGTIKMFSNGF